MCIIYIGMASAIHNDIFIVMPLITCHNMRTELQPWCRREFMRNVWECKWEWHVGNVVVLYLGIIRLAHTQTAFCLRSNWTIILHFAWEQPCKLHFESWNMATKKVSAGPHKCCQRQDCDLPSRRGSKDVQPRQTWWRKCPINMFRPILWSMTWTEKTELERTESEFLPADAKACKLAIVRPSQDFKEKTFGRSGNHRNKTLKNEIQL